MICIELISTWNQFKPKIKEMKRKWEKEMLAYEVSAKLTKGDTDLNWMDSVW